MGWQDIVRQITEDPSPRDPQLAALQRIEGHLRSISNSLGFLVVLILLSMLMAFGSSLLTAADRASPNPPAPASSTP